MTCYPYQSAHIIAQCIAAEVVSLPYAVPGMTDEINAEKQRAVPGIVTSLQYI